MAKTKTVLFLGAGFSVPFGQPAMNSFFRYASNVLEPDDLKFLSAILSDSYGANRLLESSPWNLEDILTLSVMTGRVKPSGPDQEMRAPRLREIIRRVYSPHLDEQEKYFDRYQPIRKIIDRFEIDLTRLKIITTNYDLNVESALLFLNCSAELAFPFGDHLTDPESMNSRDIQYESDLCVRPQKEGQRRTIQSVPLFKLHGSVNWFLSEDGLVQVANRVISVRRTGAQYPEPLISYFRPPESPPLIVPPTYLKTNMGTALEQNWEGAAQALQETSHLIFIGYSFPTSDIEMKYLLASGLAQNTEFQKITVVDIQADKIVERLPSAASGYGSHFKAYLDPVESDWTTIKTKRDLTRP